MEVTKIVTAGCRIKRGSVESEADINMIASVSGQRAPVKSREANKLKQAQRSHRTFFEVQVFSLDSITE
jgi:hypothetical protein